jgi:sporulation protein YlmC with PRC-barrel domain
MAILSTSSLSGDNVVNLNGEDLGTVKDFMVDTDNGRVVYAVLSFGGFLGMGDKLFAVPLEALRVDLENKRFILDADKDKLENAPGFDDDTWPQSADRSFIDKVYSHYGVKSYYDYAGIPH